MSKIPQDLPIEAIRKTVHEHGVHAAYVFGSVAHGMATPESDLDIAVLMPGEWDAHKSFVFCALLESKLSSITSRTTEVLILNDAQPLARFEAVFHGQLIFETDEEERIRFEMRVRDDYEDYCHIQLFFEAALRERVGVEKAKS